MKLNDFPELIQELADLVKARRDVGSLEVKQSNIYQTLQTTAHFDATALDIKVFDKTCTTTGIVSNCFESAMLLLAKIACKSVTLKSIDISSNALDSHYALAIAAELVKSVSLEKVKNDKH